MWFLPTPPDGTEGHVRTHLRKTLDRFVAKGRATSTFEGVVAGRGGGG